MHNRLRSKPRDQAVALRYKKDETAPRVVAKGSGSIAQKIRETATANGIPVHKDDDLVELLSAVEINHEIPPELYAAVAEILSWLYRANEAVKKEYAE